MKQRQEDGTCPPTVKAHPPARLAIRIGRGRICPQARPSSPAVQRTYYETEL
jgi:hypothetical protein